MMKTLKQADSAYRNGQFERAETLYRKILEQQPENGRIEGQLGLLALWRNDLDEADRLLQSAQAHGPWWSKIWPINATIDYHLGLLYSRKGWTDLAAAHLRKGAGRFSFGPFKMMQIVADQLDSFDDRGMYLVEGPQRGDISFLFLEPLPSIEVSVNGSGPVEFILDTGGEGVTLDQVFADKVGARLFGEIQGEYAGGKSGKTGIGSIEKIELGEFSVHQVPVTVLDLEPAATRVFSGRPVAGIIGTGFLYRFLATLDYPNRRLRLQRKLQDADTVDSLLQLTGSEHQFPMRLVETHMIFAEGSLNAQQPVQMFIDTGLAGAAFTTSQKYYAKAGVALDWSNTIIGAGGGGEVEGIIVDIDQITLGNGYDTVRKTNLTGVATKQDISLFNGSAGFKVGGLISHQFFLDHALSFDFQNMRLILQ